MIFHVSFHKYTPAYANTGNMYLFHVLLINNNELWFEEDIGGRTKEGHNRFEGTKIRSIVNGIPE